MQFDKQVHLPVGHFRKSAKREYLNWRRAIVREFYQNSVDADATEIRFTIDELPNHYLLTVKDNGTGMSIQDVEEKLLTMGGTDKGENSIGGYGVAKQILYFAWSHWEIHSRDYKVVGSGCRYTIVPNEYTDGVYAIVHLEKDEPVTETTIQSYLKLCCPKVKTLVNGTEFTEWTNQGELFKSLPWAHLHKKTGGNGYVNVQVRGVHMFSTWVSGETDIVVELSGNAREILTSNRDGLNNPFGQELQTILNDICVNTKSALLPQNNVVLQAFEGRGNTFVSADEFNIPDLSNAVRQMRAKLHHEELESKFYVPEDQPAPSFGANFSDTSQRNPENVETFVPTILVKTIGNNLPKKFNPESWNQKTAKMMALWQRVLRQIFRDSRVSCIFGIGMTFDPDARAEIVYKNEVPFFLLNPDIWRHKLNLSGKSRWLIIQEMKQRALHEIGHFVTEDHNHNENFVLTVAALEANTWRNDDAYRKLNKLKKIEFLK